MMEISRISFDGSPRYAERCADGFRLFPDNWKIGDPLVHGVAADMLTPIEASFLLPVEPSKIVCVGRNYAEHAAELGNPLPDEPLLFLKAPSALVGEGDPILIPTQSQRVEHEGELAIVIGRKCKNVPAEADPSEYILGFLCANDVTARDLQRKDVQFTRAKSFDSFCPVSQSIATNPEIVDSRVEVRVNGEVRQDGKTSDMIFDIPHLLRYISQQMTLYPGDLVLTGTPAGVSQLFPGDECTVAIPGVGSVSNPVRSG